MIDKLESFVQGEAKDFDDLGILQTVYTEIMLRRTKVNQMGATSVLLVADYISNSGIEIDKAKKMIE